MDTESVSRATDPRLLRLVEVLPGSCSASQSGLHLDGDVLIGKGGDQVDLIAADSNVAVENGAASALEELSGNDATLAGEIELLKRMLDG